MVQEVSLFCVMCIVYYSSASVAWTLNLMMRERRVLIIIILLADNIVF